MPGYQQALGGGAKEKFMKGNRMHNGTKLLTGMLLLGILALFLAPQSVSAQEEHQEFWTFFQKVQDILTGKNVEQTLDVISPEAQLISGGEFQNLRSIVAGTVNGHSLADSTFQSVMIQVKTNASEDMGYIILKTQISGAPTVRYHSIVFMRDSSGQYSIQSWHAGAAR